MATFPALAPVGRRYSFGTVPVTVEPGGVRFLHDTQRSGCSLELQYEDLTQAEIELIRNHYRGQDGTHGSFELSSEAWAGHTSMTDLVPAGTRWVYTGPPEEEQRRGGFVDVGVSLRSVIDGT